MGHKPILEHTHPHMHLSSTHFKFYKTTTGDHAFNPAKTFPHHATFSLISKPVQKICLSVTVDVLNQSKLKYVGGKRLSQLLGSKVLEINFPHVMPHSHKERGRKREAACCTGEEWGVLFRRSS